MSIDLLNSYPFDEVIPYDDEECEATVYRLEDLLNETE